MASCDDDFSLLTDDHHHHLSTTAHHHHTPPPPPPFNHHHRYLSKVSGESSPVKLAGTSGNDAVFDVNPYETDFDSDLTPDPTKSRVCDDEQSPMTDKRKDRDDVSDCGGYKKSKSVSSGVSGGAIVVVSGGEYRKDREEWSDSAIECLLDAYTDKYTQLNRGNLRGRDWEEVAAVVGERCENQSKSVEQCKNKVDNLKKRYKLERHRMSSAGVTVSHWPWYKKMEVIVGNSVSVRSGSEEDKCSGSGGSGGRQHKRYSSVVTPCLGQVNNTKSKSISSVKWQRVVFKISGAALAGNGPHNVDPKLQGVGLVPHRLYVQLMKELCIKWALSPNRLVFGVAMLIAREVAMAYRLGVQIAIVVGGRNFFCGETWINATGADRSTTYHIGKMATLMNSVLLQSALEKMGVQARLQTAFALPEIGEPYNRQKAIRHLEKGRVVIFGAVGGGSGNPLFSTDTTAALRANDVNAHAILKGTNVDGIYDCNSSSNGVTFEHISFREAAARGPTSMDMMALTFCEENAIPVVVFNLLEPGNISRALCGEQIGTLIDQTGLIS